MNQGSIMQVAVLLAASSAILAVSGSQVAAQQQRVEYDISFPNAGVHEGHVVATFTGVPRGRTLHVRMSKSSPGRYAVASFAKNVYDVVATDGKGKALTAGRPDSHGWDIAGHDGTVRVEYTVWGDRIDGTYLSIDHTHAHMNMPATFMWARGLENAPVGLTIHPQPGWSVATQLEKTKDSTRFTAPNLQYFFDSPTEVGPVTWRTWTGTHAGKTSTWRMAVHHLGTEAQVDTFTTMARAIVAEEVAMWGEPAGYDHGTYTFIADYVPWATGDGMEHRNSTFISRGGDLSDNARRMSALGTLSHEFFHSWNMERLRSKELEPFDFDHEDMSNALWFGEGFTQYYGDLFIRRAGFRTDSQYVARLGASVIGTIMSPARQHGSPIDMSRQAIFFDGGSFLDATIQSNIFISYYQWGAVVAAGLDLALRSRFHSSLDEYMRLLWRDFGSHQSRALVPERPYTVTDLRNELARLTKDEAFATEFFRRYVEGREVPDFAALLAPAGYSMVRESVARPYLGASLDNDSLGVFINWSAGNGSAFAAGLASGDIVTSIDGERAASIDGLNAIIAKHKVGDVVKVNLLQKGHIPGTVDMKLVGMNAMKVVPFENAGMPVTDAIRAFRRDWLGSKVVH
ncbi:MAG TPA: PDZ domain-containing protein [Gemmatimonadaceae bacterium]|nr:PDZ domain-containing protein [Gemmatimonadaceae bacterium]